MFISAPRPRARRSAAAHHRARPRPHRRALRLRRAPSPGERVLGDRRDRRRPPRRGLDTGSRPGRSRERAHPYYDRSARLRRRRARALAAVRRQRRRRAPDRAGARAGEGPVRVYGGGDRRRRPRRPAALAQPVARAHVPLRQRRAGDAVRPDASGATCSGDSGGGLMFPARRRGCSASTRSASTTATSTATSASAPATSTSRRRRSPSWLRQPRRRPAARTTRAAITPGDPLTCQSPAWSGDPQVTFDFVAVDTGQLLQSGPATYRPTVRTSAARSPASRSRATPAGRPRRSRPAGHNVRPGLGLPRRPTARDRLARGAEAPLSRLAVYNSAGARSASPRSTSPSR